MTLPIPLTVRLSTARADRHIEHELRSLSFRSIAPGGFASATLTLDRPLHLSPDEIAYYGSVDIYDARNGNCVWCGRLEEPGRGAGADGEIWGLTAVGPAAHASDQKRDYIIIDTSTDNWERDSISPKAARTDVELDDDDDDTESLVSIWSEGMMANNGASIRWMYQPLKRAGQKLGRARIQTEHPVTDASNWEDRLISRASGSYILVDSHGWSTSVQTLSGSVGGSPAITDGHNRLFLSSVRTGASSGVGNLTRYSRYTTLMVRAALKNADGTDISSGYTNNYVSAHQIVRDLLGRRLNQYDGADATVDTSSTVQIDQAAWPDGVTAAEVFEDLMVLEPTKYWAAWDKNSAGKYHFEWRTWPTHVRYEADAVDGFDSPGSAEGLYNMVTVRWQGAKARTRTRRRSQTVQVLDDANLTREAMIDIGGGVGSIANAIQAGDQFLADHKTPPNSGRLTVARSIYDHDRGTTAMPWEIRPGHLLRVRGVRPNLDSLNATDRDGVTVFRIVAVDYDTASASATVELDSFAPSTARALANLRKDVRRLRRRG